jgi:GT2 family glycosyltransferase
MSQFAPPTRSRAYAANPHEALRRHVVTAVLVSHDGERWLPTVLEALLGQQRPVQRIVAVDTGSRDRSADLLRSALGPDAVLERKRSTGYGSAVSFGLKNSEPVGYDEFGYDAEAPVEWVWLLHDDSAPSADCLGQLLLTAEEYSQAHPQEQVAVLGPKVHGWYDKRQLLEVGVTVAGNGRRWTGLERGEHDQGQYDEVRPVLSVGSAGMLVRRDVWDQLKGFDRAVSLFRDDLDFCWRANNAGYKVLVAPEAVIRHAEAAARERRRVDAGPNRPHLLDRAHALYTVAVNRPSLFWPFLYLRLIFGTFFRVLGHLIAKSPGKASDEFFAMLGFAARPDRILRGRAARRKHREADPLEVAQLLPPRWALTRAAIDSIWTQIRGDKALESGVTASRHGSVESGPVSEEAESLETDSLAVIKKLLRQPIVAVGLGLTAVALIAGRSLLVGGTLAGGALLPTPGGASDLWHEYLAGWHGVGLGTNSPAPAYIGLLALLSTVLFGKASLAVLILLLGSVPLAGLSASYAFRRVTDSHVLRLWGGYAYGLLAVSLGAVAGGRLGSAVAVALLPLVVTSAANAIGGPGRTGSTRSAWTCAFLLTLATAFAPVVWLLAAVVGAVSLVTVGWRARSNVLVVAIRMGIILATPMVVLAPWSLSLIKNPSGFLVEIGAAGYGLGSPVSKPLGLLLGDPGGPGTYPYWFGAGLLLTALAALLRGTRRRVVVAAWMLTLLGFASALVLTRTTVTPVGAAVGVVPWPGVSTALLGFGLITATVVGAEGARERIAGAEFGWRQPLTVLVTGAAVLAPAAAGAWWLIHGAAGPISRIDAGLPQYLAAEDLGPSQVRTLTLTGGANGTVAYSIARGSGPYLGLADIRLDAADSSKLDTLVAGLLSGSGGDAAQGLTDLGIGYVWASSSVPAGIAHALNATSGLTEQALGNSASSGSEYWQVNGTVGRVMLQDGKGAQLALSYQCSGTMPTGPNTACAQDVTASVQVAAGPAGRLLVLAEQANGGWTAKENGQTLTAVPQSNGLQAWAVPADAGTIVIGYQSYTHTFWLIGEAVAFAAAMIMALPFGRRLEDQPDEEDEYAEAAQAAEEAEVQAATVGRRARGGPPAEEPETVAVPEPRQEEPLPEREREAPIPMPAQAEAPAAESYQPDGYEDGGYGYAEEQQYSDTGSYQAPVYETAQAFLESEPYGSGSHQTGEYGYEQSGAGYGYAQEQYQPDQYQQHGAYESGYESGSYEQPQEPQYQPDQYQQHGAYESGYESGSYEQPQEPQYQPDQYETYDPYPQQSGYAEGGYGYEPATPYQPATQQQEYEQEYSAGYDPYAEPYPAQQYQQHYSEPYGDAAQDGRPAQQGEQYPEFEQYPAGYGQSEQQYGQEGWGR